MHHCKGTQGTQFIFHSDFSGDIEIRTPDGKEVQVPAQDILELVAYNYVCNKRIAHIEQLGWEELLSL